VRMRSRIHLKLRSKGKTSLVETSPEEKTMLVEIAVPIDLIIESWIHWLNFLIYDEMIYLNDGLLHLKISHISTLGDVRDRISEGGVVEGELADNSVSVCENTVGSIGYGDRGREVSGFVFSADLMETWWETSLHWDTVISTLNNSRSRISEGGVVEGDWTSVSLSELVVSVGTIGDFNRGREVP